jgi:hypothetical protein
LNRITQVAKRLPVHPPDLGGLCGRCAIGQRSDRQKAPDLIAALRPPRKPAHLNRCKICPNRNRLAHGNPSTYHVESSIL